MFIVGTLLLSLNLSLPTISGRIYTSLLMQSSMLIAPPPVVLQAGTAGSSTIYSNSTSAKVSQGWLTDFQYRKKITFNNSVISENLVNFTVPIIFNSSNADFWGHVQTDGNDTRFVNADNTTELYYEFEKFNHTSDDMIAWVKVPQIDASSTIDYIWVYYGNSTVDFDSYCNSSGVWDSNYAAVWHLDETSGGSSGIKDSTANANAGTDAGSPAFGQTGQIGNAVSFNGSGQEIQTPNSASLQITGNITVEAWAKSAVSNQYGGIAGKMKSDGGTAYAGYDIQKLNANNKFGLETANGGSSTEVTAVSDSAYTDINWHFIVGVRSGTINYLYVDGVQQTATGTMPIADSGLVGTIGREYSDYDGGWWNGTIDEVRISDIGRSANWVKACYQYEVDQSKFTYGSEESAPATYDYVLRIVNQDPKAWNVSLRVYGSSNIARLSSTIISFHDGTPSDQIVVTNGSITQSQGPLYSLPGGAGSTIYVSMSNPQASTTGTSYLYVYLKVLVPNTTTYSLYAITFEIT
jgi:hypothetical protein